MTLEVSGSQDRVDSVPVTSLEDIPLLAPSRKPHQDEPESNRPSHAVTKFYRSRLEAIASRLEDHAVPDCTA